MKFKVQVGGSQVSGSSSSGSILTPNKLCSSILGLTPMELKWAFSCPRFWPISGCFKCGQMGKAFPFKGLPGQHHFLHQALFQDSRDAVGGKEEHGETT